MSTLVDQLPRLRAYGGGAAVAHDLETLAQIRGAMWTARLNLPFGPRPGRDSNILAMDYYEHFSAEDRRRMIAAYQARGYTHAVTGPMVDPDGYHGQYPRVPDLPTQATWDHYLDAMQEWADAGILPIHFAHPDNWSIEQMAQLIPFYRQERAQRLLPIVVWTGWEPTRYDWTSAYWVRFLQQGADVFPHALRLVHTVTDVDALTGGDDDRTFPAGEGNIYAWRAAVPYLHGWLVQNGGYFDGPTATGDPGRPSSGVPTPSFAGNFVDQFDDTQGRASLTARFRHGIGDWPTNSAWGPEKPLKVYAAEFAAYPNYWGDWPESEARKLGDLALAAGADGVLDGCFDGRGVR